MNAKLAKKALMFISAAFASTMLFAQQATPDIERMQQANADLDKMTQELATLVAQPGFRGFLRSEIAKSKNTEKILELDKFLDRASKQKKMPPGLIKFKDSAQKAKQRLEASGVSAFRGYDLYIPVQAHREKWKGGKDFLVAFNPVDDTNIPHIVAYQVWDGKRVLLDPNEPPEKVVLVLAAEEHESHEVHDAPEEGPAPPSVVPRDSGPDLEKPGEFGEGNSFIHAKWLMITNDREPWTSGAPEIYAYGFLVKKDNKCSSWREWLDRVNKENNWYYRYYDLEYPFDSTYKDIMGFLVMEEDCCTYGLQIKEFSPGSACSWRKKGGDDQVGWTVIYKSAVPWNYDRYWSFGYARVYWYKRH